MKRRITAYFASAALLLSTTSVCAEALINSLEVTEGGRITAVITAEPYARVAVKVQKENDTVPGFVDEKAVDENGTVSFDFMMPASCSEGKYILSYCEGEDDAKQYSFDFADPTDFVEKLNAVSKWEDVAALLTPSAGNRYKAEFMGWDMEIYDAFSEQERQEMLQCYLDIRIGTTQDAHTEAFTKAMGLQISDKDNAKALELYNPEFEGKKYNELTDEEHQQWIVKALNVTEKTIEGFEKAYTQAQAVYKLTMAKSAEVAGIIRDYGELLGITASPKYTQYSGLSSNGKGKVYEQIVNNIGNAYTPQEVCRIFEAAVTAAASQNNGGGNGGGGGSHNSGNSSTGREVVVGNTETLDTQNHAPFQDLTGYAWAEQAITSLAEKEVISGYGDGSFRPAQTVTREEFVKMAVCAAGIFNPNAECGFADTDSGQWYYRYIASGVENGIIDGIGDNRFGIGEPVSRQDMTVIVCRLAEKQGVDMAAKRSYANFNDEAFIADYAKESVQKLYAAKMINGVETTRFAPLDNATRAQAAKILYDVFYDSEVTR